MSRNHFPAMLAFAGMMTVPGCRLSGPESLEDGRVSTEIPLSALGDGLHQGRIQDYLGTLEYPVLRDVQFHGVTIPKGQSLRGMPGWEKSGGKSVYGWIIPPEFLEVIGREKMVFGRRFGSSKFVRLELENEQRAKEVPTNFTRILPLVWAWNTPGFDHRIDEKTRWFGVDDDGRTISLLDEKGLPLNELKDPIDLDATRSVTELSEGAMVVRFQDYCRIYGPDGRPMTPEITSLDLIGINLAVVGLNDAHGCCWLVNGDGTIHARPDDLCGLVELRSKPGPDYEWRGWQVWWKTPRGDRCAHIEHSAATDFVAVMASKSEARWSHITGCAHGIACQDPDTGKWQAFRNGKAVTDRWFDSAEETAKYMDDVDSAEYEEKLRQERILAAEERRQEQAREQARLAAEAEARRQAQIQAEEQLQDARQRFDAAMTTRDRSGARAALLRIPRDPSRWNAYLRSFGLDPATENSSESIGFARATLGGADEHVLANALAQTRPTAPSQYEEPQSDWDYFWNGPRNGVHIPLGGNYQVDPRLTTSGVSQHLEEVRRQNLDAWSRGAQHWGVEPVVRHY